MSNSYSLVDIGTKVAPAINPTITGASAQVTNTISASSLAAAASAAQVVTAASLAMGVALVLYPKEYASQDDHRLLEKISMEDCGGLSKMATNIEGCFRQYVSKATHRAIMSPNYMVFHNRFQECFAKRPVHPCSFWGEDVFTSTGG